MYRKVQNCCLNFLFDQDYNKPDNIEPISQTNLNIEKQIENILLSLQHLAKKANLD
jgi:hypothetical protein